jgi:hypothetical protein
MQRQTIWVIRRFDQYSLAYNVVEKLPQKASLCGPEPLDKPQPYSLAKKWHKQGGSLALETTMIDCFLESNLGLHVI